MAYETRLVFDRNSRRGRALRRKKIVLSIFILAIGALLLWFAVGTSESASGSAVIKAGQPAPPRVRTVPKVIPGGLSPEMF